MSIAPPPNPAPQTTGSSTSSVSDQLIDARIVEACKALWWAEVVRTLLRLVIVAIGLLLVWVVVDQWVYSPGNGLRIVLFAAICVSLVWYVLRRVVPLLGSAIRPEYAARSLERDLPELRQSLTSYVMLRDDQETPGLRSRVVRSIGASAAGRLRAHDELPQEATGTLRLWIATAIALAVLVAYAVVSPKNSLQSAARLAVPFASIDPAMRVSIRDVKPGDVEAIAGREVEVSAVISGMRGEEEAVCRLKLPAGRQDVVLSQDSETRRHAGTILLPHSATGQVDYVIAAGDAEVGPFRLHVQDVPVVALQTVRYQPPKYTGQSPHTSSSGAITALDGTQVTIFATTNRAVAKAKIEFNPRVLGESVQATAGVAELKIDSAGTSLSVSFPLRSARGRSAAVELESYRIKVWDAAGQGNPEPIIYPIRVIADLPPDVAIMMPVKSPQDVPIDVQQPFEIHASDPDFGLMQIGLEIRAGIDLIAEPVLWSDAHDSSGNQDSNGNQDAKGNQGAKGNRVSEYGFRPAEHDLRIGDTVHIVAVAIDNRANEHDPSVEPNITRTDPIELRITASDPRQGDPSADEQSLPDRRQSDDPSKKSESSSGGEGQQQSGSGGGGSGEQQSGEGKSGGDSSGNSQSGDSSAENSGEGGSGGGAGDKKSADQNSGAGESGESDSSDGSGDRSGAGSSGGAGPQQGQSETDSMSEREGQTPSGADSPSQGAPPEDGSPEGAQGKESSTGKQTSTPTGEAGDAGAEGQPTSDPKSSGGASSNRGASSGDPSSGENTGDDAAGNEAPKHDGETFERIRDYLEQKRNEQQDKEQQGSGDGSKPENSQGDSSNSQSADKNQSSPESGSQADRKSVDPQSTQGSDSSDQQSAGDGDASNEKSGDGDSGEQSGSSSKRDGSESGEGSANEDGSPSQPAGDGSEQGSAGNEQGSGEKQGSGNEQGTGDEQGTGKKQTGEGQPSPGEGGSKSSDQNSGEGSGEQSAKSGAGKKPDSGDSGKNGPTGDQEPGENERGREQQRETDKPSDAQSRSDTPTDSATPSGDPSTNKSPPSDSVSGTGAGSDGVGEAGDSPLPPDPVNVDYAKKAADMVLDYIEETRDAPDRELLDKLNWTEQDLKRFADRWQNVREMGQASDVDPTRSRDVEEALKSLGMRPPTEAGDKVKDSADSLRGIRDAGNRKPPPAAYRDAFDAFRRAVGRQ